MGFFSNFFDRFKAADFQIAPNMKIKIIQSEIKNRIRFEFEISIKTKERSSCTNFEFFIDRKIGLKIKKIHHLISDVI